MRTTEKYKTAEKWSDLLELRIWMWSKFVHRKQSVEYNTIKWNIESVLDYVLRQSVPKCSLTNVVWGCTVYQAVLSSKRYKDRWDLVPIPETLSSSWENTRHRTIWICIRLCGKHKGGLLSTIQMTRYLSWVRAITQRETGRMFWARRTVKKDPIIWFD